MTPEQIAAKLTKSQVRALRQYVEINNPMLATLAVKDARRMLGSIEKTGIFRRDIEYLGVFHITPIGRAVLAVLDKGVG